MAAMLTLTDTPEYNFGLTQILAVTIPACIVGIVVTSLVSNRQGKDLADDPEVQEAIRAGLPPPIPTATTASTTEPQPALTGTADSDAIQPHAVTPGRAQAADTRAAARACLRPADRHQGGTQLRAPRSSSGAGVDRHPAECPRTCAPPSTSRAEDPCRST